MKTNFPSCKELFFLSILSFTITLASCSKDDNPVIVSNTITDKIDKKNSSLQEGKFVFICLLF